MAETTTREESAERFYKEIDSIDETLVNLMVCRAVAVQSIQRIRGGAREDAVARVRAVVNHAVAHAKELSSPIPASEVGRLLRELDGVCWSLSDPVRVAFLGPAGTFCEMAAVKHFSSAPMRIACADIDAVFNAAETSRADFAVVPIENSNQGTVTRTLDLLMRTPLPIVAEIRIPVVHNLLSKARSLSEVVRVTAHPQALSQCQGWLKAHLPEARLVPASSNAAAASAVAGDPKSAAIAARAAAALYGLHVLEKSIQDNPNNETRFIVLGHEAPGRPGTLPSKTSLLFSVANRAGALFEALQPLQTYGVSMDKLESRPSQQRPWEYNFFVDLDGHVEDAPVAQALEALRAKTSFFKLLGSYPKAI